eukprot:1159381-Pelagomonas_calceolata.AAC.16
MTKNGAVHEPRRIGTRPDQISRVAYSYDIIQCKKGCFTSFAYAISRGKKRRGADHDDQNLNIDGQASWTRNTEITHM